MSGVGGRTGSANGRSHFWSSDVRVVLGSARARPAMRGSSQPGAERSISARTFHFFHASVRRSRKFSCGRPGAVSAGGKYCAM